MTAFERVQGNAIYTPSELAARSAELTTGAERSDLTELAAFLNEVRTVWRAADQPKRDRIRRGVLVVLRGCRPGAEPFAGNPEPLSVTDTGWFTERAGEFEVMDRDQLLNEARKWAFDYQQAALRANRINTGTAALTKDISRRLAQAKYLARSGKTIRADDLKIILDDCMHCDGRGELVRDGYVSCRACADAIAAQKPVAASTAAADALFALAKED